jgi:hypothetical protein
VLNKKESNDIMTQPKITPDIYIENLPDDRREAMNRLRKTLLENLPKGFEETIQYGMIAYVVPLSIYPQGYRCDPKQALPFINLASQKGHIALYHMGLYADKSLYDWFISEYSTQYKTKLDIGKSCIRFKKINEIPYDLIGQLSRKMTASDWIKIYEENYVKK